MVYYGTVLVYMYGREPCTACENGPLDLFALLLLLLVPPPDTLRKMNDAEVVPFDRYPPPLFKYQKLPIHYQRVCERGSEPWLGGAQRATSALRPSSVQGKADIAVGTRTKRVTDPEVIRCTRVANR